MGGEVLEFGKPDRGVYEIIFNDIESRGIRIDKSRIFMVGDTIGTDILGAQNVGIESCLCTETGVTANEVNRLLKGQIGESSEEGLNFSGEEERIAKFKIAVLEKLMKDGGAEVTCLLKGLSVDYKR
ncbi:MAG: HAD hydrolase-like protein [Rickettsiales bacterium]|jgi:FMN phosphatase YigB (HAD superfamily)|nr:HAD hydrolase-like protein [Rickettsiales bacterium]